MASFKANIKKFQVFKSLIDFLNQIREDTYFTFNKDGVTFKTRDLSKTAIVQGQIKPSMFDNLDVDGELSLCFSTKDIMKWFRRIKDEDSLSVTVTEDGEMDFVSPHRKFQLFSLEAEDLEATPHFVRTFDVYFDIGLEQLYDATQDIAVASDVFFIETTPTGMLMRVPITAPLKKVWIEIPYPGLPQDVKSGFGILFFEPLKALISSIDKVKVNFGHEAPMIIHINTPEYEIQYIFAPRLEPED